MIEFDNPPLELNDGTPIRILARTDRISTHDIGRGIIPFKDQVLAVNHNFMRRLVEPVMPHAQLSSSLPDSSVVTINRNLRSFPIENVFRAYMAETTTSTSLYMHWKKGRVMYCGIDISKYTLTPNCKLPFVMDTPSTKSSEHDESVTIESLFSEGRFNEQDWRSIRNNALVAFGIVSQYLSNKGLILVDTKTEHGKDTDGKIYVMDELYTMDSSRFWKKSIDGYPLIGTDMKPISFSKEFAREFSKGNEPYTEEQQLLIGARYVEGIEHLTGTKFIPDPSPWSERVIRDINTVLAEHSIS